MFSFLIEVLDFFPRGASRRRLFLLVINQKLNRPESPELDFRFFNAKKWQKEKGRKEGGFVPRARMATQLLDLYRVRFIQGSIYTGFDLYRVRFIQG